MQSELPTRLGFGHPLRISGIKAVRQIDLGDRFPGIAHAGGKTEAGQRGQAGQIVSALAKNRLAHVATEVIVVNIRNSELIHRIVIKCILVGDISSDDVLDLIVAGVPKQLEFLRPIVLVEMNAVAAVIGVIIANQLIGWGQSFRPLRLGGQIAHHIFELNIGGRIIGGAVREQQGMRGKRRREDLFRLVIADPLLLGESRNDRRERAGNRGIERNSIAVS